MFSAPRANALPNRGESPHAASGPAEFVINWPAIGVSLALLALLIGLPAALLAWQPAWLGFWGATDADSGLLVFTVDHSVHPAPPAAGDNPALEALRRREADDLEERAADHNDSTRRTYRTRYSPPLATTAPELDDDLNNSIAAVVSAPAPDNDKETERSVQVEDRRNMRLNLAPEIELLEHLCVRVPELRLDDTGQLSSKIIKAAREKDTGEIDKLPDASMLRNLVAEHEEFAGLPFRWDGGCRIEGERLKALCEVSATLRAIDARSIGLIGGASITSEQAISQSNQLTLLTEKIVESKGWQTSHHVPALEQMLQTEETCLQSALIDVLAHIPGSASSQALARRALYALSPEVRTMALKALKERDPADYQSTLVSGLRYPWAPVALNAADALVELDLKGAVPELKRMADLPPPTAPHRDEQGRWVVRELVKVNHMRNCALCHAPAGEVSGSLSAFVPAPGKPLPAVYYQGRISSGEFVRADITYLRQDFSVIHVAQSTSASDPWPMFQRFDFLVRTRTLPPDEQDRLNKAPSTEIDSPQREALLYALRRLTGDPAIPATAESPVPGSARSDL
jgi:hypothetical protein